MDSRAVAASSRATYAPSLAPDGSALAYITDDDGYTRAVQCTLDGISAGEPREVTLPVEGPISAVQYSQDGHFLACEVAPHSASHTQVWVVTSNPKDHRAWRVDGLDAESAELVGWDGDHVLITVERSDGYGEARSVNPHSGVITVLDARPEARLLDAAAGVCVVRTGPRSDRAARVLWGDRDLLLFDKDSGSVTDQAVILDRVGWRNSFTDNEIERPITFDGSDFPATSSDSLRILCRSDVGTNYARLAMATVTEHTVHHRVLAERDEDLDTFAVSANGRRAVLVWNTGGGRTQVQLLDLSQKPDQEHALRPPLHMPPGVVSEPHLSADGQLLSFTLQSPQHERSVHVMDLRTGQHAAIDPVPFDSRAVEPQLITFTARDGLALSGWLYLAPTDGAASRPFVIHLHGGPEGQERPGYSPTYPTLLAAGISVFAPNVRGSGGFGRAFVHADDRNLRIGSINDVADAAAYLVSSDLTEADKIAIAGWSYGGYLTMATLAFHDVACCGIAVSGMSDLRTFHATTQPWISRAARSKYGTPGTDDAIMAEVAPLLRAHEVRVPLLVIHGGNDTNVPPSESTQMADAVRAHEGRAETVILDGEGHEFVRHASRDLIARLIRDAVLTRTS